MQLFKTHKNFNEDSALIEACIRNERPAQHKLYDRYKNAMYSTAFRITGNSDLAADALQEAFMDVFEQIANFRSESTLGAWIKTIVVRKSIRHIKQISQTETLEKVDQIDEYNWSHAIDAEYLDKTIQTLPEAAKAVFLLIEVEGFKHAEVAEMLNISEGTSKSQLNYSKKLLQKKLYKYYKS